MPFDRVARDCLEGLGSRWSKHPAMRYSYPPAPPICRDQAPPMARLSHWAIALTINLSPSTDRPAIVKKTSFRATLGSSDHRGTFLRLSLVTCPIVRRAPRRKHIRIDQLNAETGNRPARQLIDSKSVENVDRDQSSSAGAMSRSPMGHRTPIGCVRPGELPRALSGRTARAGRGRRQKGW